jgi:flagellin-like hook-associated protein FlgL
MDEIVIGAATRTSLFALQDVTSKMTRVQARLATGKRVNGPIDDPAAFFTASSLNARAASLNALMDGINGAQKTIEAANTGIAAIKSLLNSAKSLANQALASPDTLVEIAGTNTIALTAATQIASTAGSATLFKAGDEVTVDDGTTTATYTAADGDTVQDVLDAINNTANLKVDASLNSSGQIVLTATDTVDVTVAATLTGAGTLNGVAGLTAATTEFEVNTTRQSYAQQFDAVREQIDQAVQDAGYNGTNLLASDNLTVTFNETGTSKLTLTGDAFTATDLGVAASVGDFQLDSAIDAAIDAVTAAVTELEAKATVFSSNSAIVDTRQEFTESLAATLTAGADRLVATDLDEDSAVLLALQTRQQLISTMLSLNSENTQNSLRMFGLA